jgi:hypothetical protein
VAVGPGDPAWAETDALLLRAVDELVEARRLADSTWTALAGRYSVPQLLQLILLAGHYVMLAGFLNSARVAVESVEMAGLGEAPGNPTTVR